MARDVSAQLSQPVTELTASSDASAPLARVVVGTEAVWQRVRRCALVVFIDFDQYLLAPREESRRRAITAVGKAARLVGPRSEGRGEVVLQTRRSDDVVVQSLELGDFDEVIADDVATARLLGVPPYGALATISGDGAPEFVLGLHDSPVSVHEVQGEYVVRAASVEVLTAALREARRPVGKLRIAVQ